MKYRITYIAKNPEVKMRWYFTPHTRFKCTPLESEAELIEDKSEVDKAFIEPYHKLYWKKIVEVVAIV
jgi:hypothetical protein